MSSLSTTAIIQVKPGREEKTEEGIATNMVFYKTYIDTQTPKIFRVITFIVPSQCIQPKETIVSLSPKKIYETEVKQQISEVMNIIQ